LRSAGVLVARAELSALVAHNGSQANIDSVGVGAEEGSSEEKGSSFVHRKLIVITLAITGLYIVIIGRV
jgi:hypothetical protein